MKTRTRRWRLLLLITTLAMVVAACGESQDATDDTTEDGVTTTEGADDPGEDTSSTEPEQAEGGGTIQGRLGAEPTAIDPQLVAESEGFEITRLLFDGLTLYDPAGGAVIPGVAESWEPNEDNTVWTFHLREGTTFSDGTPVTAQSFVDGWNRLADPDLASSVAYHGGSHGANILGWDEINLAEEGTGAVGDEQVEGLVAVDDLTLEVTTAESMAFLPKIVAHPAFSPVNAELVPTDPASADRTWTDMPVGNGPYQMVEPWQHEVSITLERNESYYGEAGNADTIEFTIFTEPAVEFQALLDGQIDVSLILNEQLDQARANYPDNFGEIPRGSFNYLGFPNETAPYDNPELRRALVMAVDREAIVTRILQGTLANGFVPPVAFGSVDGLDTCEACAFDPEAAAELFDSLGGIPGNEVTIAFNAGGGHEEWVEAVANDWTNNLGLDVTFQTLEWAAYLEFLGLTGGPPAVEPFRLAWAWDYPSAYNFLAPLYVSGSDDNFTQYSNEDFDALIEQAAAAPTEEDAIPFLEEAQAIIADDMPVMPLNYGLARWAWNDTVENVNYNDFGFFLWEDIQVVE